MVGAANEVEERRDIPRKISDFTSSIYLHWGVWALHTDLDDKKVREWMVAAIYSPLRLVYLSTYCSPRHQLSAFFVVGVRFRRTSQGHTASSTGEKGE